MREDNKWLEYSAKVNKVILIIMWVFLVFSIFGSVRVSQISISLICEIIFAIGMTIIVQRKVLCKATSYMLILGFVFITFNAAPSPENIGLFAMIALCITALYLNKNNLLLCGALYNVILIFGQLEYHKFASEDFSTTLLSMEFVILILFFVCKWGSDLIETVSQKETQSKVLLSEQENVVKIIKENNLALNDNISSCNERTNALKEISASMAASIQEITNGVIEQSGSINQISQMMNKANEKMSEINNLSKNLADTSVGTSQVVLEGSEKIDDMEQQMRIIKQAVSESLSTAEELSYSMNDINNFLSSIIGISEQTNLLALNATIEAARAGEAGKGFAVVANEVGKLAEQSSSTVKQIDRIVCEMKNKIDHVLEKTNSGSVAVKEGETITKQVNDGFEKIKMSFKNIDEIIINELQMTENISSIFKDISQQAESISSISEEHSASTEEMLATTEEQVSSIEDIYELMQHINADSMNLKNMIEKR